MSAQVIKLGQGAILRVDAAGTAGVRIHAGRVWLTQHDDPTDYVLKRGDRIALKAEGAAVISATQPSLLELYRQDATSLRRTIEGRVRVQRAAEMRAFFARLFRRGRLSGT